MTNRQPKELIDLEDVIYNLIGIKSLIMGLPSIANLANGFDDACNVLADTLGEEIETLKEIFDNEWEKQKGGENDLR